jgi:hypothetical protein
MMGIVAFDLRCVGGLFLPHRPQAARAYSDRPPKFVFGRPGGLYHSIGEIIDGKESM